MPWIAAAVLVGSYHQAKEAKKARQSAEQQQTLALAQQEKDAAAMRSTLAEQTKAAMLQAGSLEQQALTSKQQFESAQAQYAENKSAMEKKAAEVQAAADEERRKAAASEASALKARTRGGRRSLLSQERMDSELGVTSMLGSGMSVQ
jgi:hypothetical protein